MAAAKTFQEWVAVLSWHDGDTFAGALDQGVGIFRGGGLAVVAGHIELAPIRHRAALINAPELTISGKPNPAGLDALNYAQELAPPGMYQCITYKADDTFDRPLIDLILPAGRFSALMLAAGMAVKYG